MEYRSLEDLIEVVLLTLGSKAKPLYHKRQSFEFKRLNGVVMLGEKFVNDLKNDLMFLNPSSDDRVYSQDVKHRTCALFMPEETLGALTLREGEDVPIIGIQRWINRVKAIRFGKKNTVARKIRCVDELRAGYVSEKDVWTTHLHSHLHCLKHLSSGKIIFSDHPDYKDKYEEYQEYIAEYNPFTGEFINKDDLSISTDSYRMFQSIQFTLSFEWMCYIRENNNSIGFRFPIDPAVSKEVFELRDIPEGRKRRKSIINFVRTHYRSIGQPNSGSLEVLIRKHLRGETKFTWRGLTIEIIPSEFDINSLKFKKEVTTFES